MSMAALYEPAPRSGTGRILLVMLPGAKTRPQDLLQHGFVRELRARNLPVDVVAVAAHLGHYLDRSLSGHLTNDIIAPARARNYRRIWLMGISLGAMGALIYTREHPTDIEGVVLLAPFLATRGTVAEVVRAGGWAGWQPGELNPGDDERELLAWLKAYQPATAGLPQLRLGYGTGDRFVAASELLAERLPPADVVAIAGGHDWTTWINLWQRLLDRGLFGDGRAAARGTVRQKRARA
ncbi:MAG: alpha/beta hydrolase [Betaproteobacteria bacterium]